MLADADPFVCRKAAESLGSYRDAVAAAALVAFLKQSQERNQWAGELAQQALQQISGAADLAPQPRGELRGGSKREASKPNLAKTGRSIGTETPATSRGARLCRARATSPCWRRP